jgi:hypothetical protein
MSKAKKTATAKSKVPLRDLKAKKNVKGGFKPGDAFKKLELNPQPLPP